MTTTVLAYFPSPPQGVWHLGPVPIRAYALFIIIGIIAALLIGDRRWEARGGERGVIYDIALWAVPFGLIGGRLYHLATDWRTYFGEGGAGPAAALRIWDGGLGIWGAVALGGVGAWIACRRRDIPLPAFGDAIAPGIILAQAIGRLGNYFNQELFGRETTMPWGLEIFYRRDPTGFVDVHSLDGVSTGQLAMVVQPTFLYEMLWNLLVFALLIYLDRRFTIGHARLFALYVAGYCIGRFGIELLRDDAATHIAGIRINTFTSTFVFIGAVVYLILAPKGREDPAKLSGSAADRLVPDSVDDETAEVATVTLPTAAVAAAAADPVTKPVEVETTAVDTAVIEKSGIEAEAVAAEAGAAELGALEAQVAETPEPAAANEVEPEEQPEGAAAEAGESAASEEPEEAEAESVAEAEEAEGEPVAEAEEAEGEPVAEAEQVAEGEQPEGEAAEAGEPPASDEPEEAEAEQVAEVEQSEDEAAEVDELPSPEEPEKVDSVPAEAVDGQAKVEQHAEAGDSQPEAARKLEAAQKSEAAAARRPDSRFLRRWLGRRRSR